MSRLCLVSHGQPSANPRLVRDASELAKAGYDVRVVTARFIGRLVSDDGTLIEAAKWRYQCVDLVPNGNGAYRWNYVRLRRRGAAELARWLRTEGIIARACTYANPELAELAATEPADLYIAYQHTALPAAAWAARRTGSRFGLDAQDLLSDCSDEPTTIMLNLEQRYLRDCAYISIPTQAAADRLQATNNLKASPIVVHNTPALEERLGVHPPTERISPEITSLYWFGQTIGPHSCAEQLLKTFPLLIKPVRLVLRGNSNERYVSELRALAERLGVSRQLEILPRAAPTEMVRLASEHDILLGTQPGTELFNQVAIGNKVFTGMMAGLALALSDTIAHRELLTSAPGCGFLFPDANSEILCEELNKLLLHPARLQDMKLHSWTMAEERFNWREESKKLLDVVGYLTKSARRDFQMSNEHEDKNYA
jgi:glycosyltransferase involved in cell wall biosynthesis